MLLIITIKIKQMITIRDFLNRCFEVRDQIHYWHLQTVSYSEHKTLQQFYEKWLDLTDQFIESYQGIGIKASGIINIQLMQYSQGCSSEYLKKHLAYINGDAREISKDSDLNALIDEMGLLLRQTLYLLTLK
jgi:hypothetical protein